MSGLIEETYKERVHVRAYKTKKKGVPQGKRQEVRLMSVQFVQITSIT